MALITFTSSFGSGGEIIAERVAERLGVEFFDDRKLQERAVSIGISSKDIEGLDEKVPRLFDRLFTNKPALYLEIIGSVVYDIASGGDGVIVGHGAQVFLKDFNCAFHVMIHASEETRSDRVAGVQSVSEEAARGLIRRMDKRLKEFVRYTFNRDWNDPSSYDLIINVDKIGAGRAVELVTELAGSEEIKACSLKALEEMEFSSLKRKVDAAMIRNNLTSPFTNIYVEVTGKGKVHLSGWTFNEDELKTAAAVAGGVPGVSEVTSDIFVQTSADA